MVIFSVSSYIVMVCPYSTHFTCLAVLNLYTFLLVYLVLTVQPTDCEYQRVVWVTYLWILGYRSCFSCLDFLTPPCCLQFSHILGWVSGGNLLLSISKIHTPGVLCLMQIFLFNSGLCFAACCVSCLIIVDWVLFVSMVSSNLLSLGWVSFALSEKHTGYVGEPSDLALNVHQVQMSHPHPCLGLQPTSIISLSESKTMLLLFMTALPSLSLHNFSCHYCLTGNGYTQSKVSTTYSSENALGGRSEIPSCSFCWCHSPQCFLYL